MDCGAAAYQAVWVAIRILVVDDNQHFRRQVGELFMLQGLEIVDAAARREGRARCCRTRLSGRGAG